VKKLLQLGKVLAAVMMALAQLALTQGAFAAQRTQRPRAQIRQQRQAVRQQKQIQKQENKPGVRGALGVPPKWVEKLQGMSPEEQERFMRNNARFQSLPPQRQEQIRRTLQRWNQMTPEQRDAMRNRAQIFNRLTPEERQEVVTDLAPRWKALPQDRKEVLNGRLRVLRGMTPSEREQALQDPQFMRGLDNNEQDLLRKITALRVGPGAGQ
jgi:hypothetical protein